MNILQSKKNVKKRQSPSARDSPQDRVINMSTSYRSIIDPLSNMRISMIDFRLHQESNMFLAL